MGGDGGRTARRTGWSGELDFCELDFREPDQPRTSSPGRHRKITEVGAEIPPRRQVGRLPEMALGHAGPWHAARPSDVPSNPLEETWPTGGLHKFDLGMVPASVTPPRTWRRAAWFTVVSSAAALGGLLLASSALVTPSYSASAPWLYSTRSPAGTSANASGGQPSGESLPADTHRPRPGEGGSGAYDPYYLDGDPQRPTRVDTPLTRPPGHNVAGHPIAGPNAGQGPAGEVPVASARAMERRSVEYMDAVTHGDFARAYGMTADPLHGEGLRSFTARYGGAVRIEVTGTRLNDHGVIKTLRIMRTDGSVVTQHRELRFTGGEQPRIITDQLVS